MNELNETIPTTRVRMNFATTAKGLAQLDVTTEAPSVEEAGSMMDKAIDSLRGIIASKGFKEAGQE